MTIQQLLLILWARRKIIVRFLGITVGLVFLVTLIMPRKYTASTSVVIDVKSPDPIAGVVLPGMISPGYMATQSDIINSERVAQRVVKLLKMDEDADLREKWQDATDGRGSMTSWMAAILQRSLNVKPSRESNVVDIEFVGSNPAFTAVVANAFAQAYIDTTIELRVEPARQYASWFDDQLKKQRERLEQAQQALSDFQQKNGIVATDERLDAETTRLTDLTAQLTQIQAQGTDINSKQRSGAADTLPEVIQSPLINELKAEVARRESKLKELSGNLGVNHPQYQSALSDLTTLQTRLRTETALIASSVGVAGKASQARESDVTAAIELQKKKLLELRKQRDAISVLMREVESAQSAFDAVSQRMTQTRLEAQSVQTNVSVLTPASEPLVPSKPRMLLNLFAAAFVGTLGGIGAALIVELGQRRIRSAEYLVYSLGIPMLVEIDSTVPPDNRHGWRSWHTYLLSRKPALLKG